MGLLQGSSIVNANGLRSTVNLNGRTNNYLTAASINASVKSELSQQDQNLRESLAAILPPDLRHLVGNPTSTSSKATGTTADSTTILNAVIQICQ